MAILRAVLVVLFAMGTVQARANPTVLRIGQRVSTGRYNYFYCETIAGMRKVIKALSEVIQHPDSKIHRDLPTGCLLQPVIFFVGQPLSKKLSGNMLQENHEVVSMFVMPGVLENPDGSKGRTIYVLIGEPDAVVLPGDH